eukprot:7796521-Alexandrium_andersonii.AAC.1
MAGASSPCGTGSCPLAGIDSTGAAPHACVGFQASASSSHKTQGGVSSGSYSSSDSSPDGGSGSVPGSAVDASSSSPSLE